MDAKKFHEKKKREVLSLCRELKATYGDDWVFVCPVLFPESWSYLKLIKKIKGKTKES